MKPIIHSTKHYVQLTLTNVTTGLLVSTNIIQSVLSVSANLANEVTEGANVKAVFVELWLIGGTADQFFTITLEKVPGAGNTQTFSESTALFSYVNKKNILYTTQGLAPNDGVGQPVPLIRQWFKIPKGKQRFGLNDMLNLNISSRGDGTLTVCGFFLYKELS